MISPRWKKVTRDLFNNKTRTILTMLSIAVGVFAVGVVTVIGSISLPDMEADYASANPASATIYCAPFDDTLLASIRSIPGVAGAEGRSTATGQILLANGQKTAVQMVGIPASDKMKINLLKYQDSIISLGKKEIIFDRSATVTGIKPGEQVSIELPDGKIKTLVFKGYVHDVTIIPYAFDGTIPAYITPETVEWLGGTTQYTSLIFNVLDYKKDKTHVADVANTISDKLKKGGTEVYSIFVFNPGRHFATDIFMAVMAILNILGWLTVFLSAFLVVNTVNSLMSQHTRQIGIMKSIGGNSNQIISMYLALISFFGVISYLFAVPLASYLGYQVCVFMSEFINFNLRPFRLIPEALALQAAIAFLVPITASLVPITAGVRMTVREAITSYGVDQGLGSSLIDRLLEHIRFLSRPMIISLRNSIRRKGRLLLTLSTLTLGGAIFIAVFNLWGALGMTMQQIEGYFLADVNIHFTRSYRSQKVQDLVMSVPGVVGFEGWKSASGQVLSLDKKNGVEINFLAPPPGSTLISPILTSGRWLVPADENAVVIGNHLVKERPDLKSGDNITIKINQKEYSFHIVGIYKMAGNVTPPILYANASYIGKITDTPGQIAEAHIITASHDLNTQRQVAQALQVLLKNEGMPVASVQLGVEWRQQQTSQTDVMVYFMLVMALLIALVGGLGLMGTMGMNIMERIREIGVMRAIGASSLDIQIIVVLEGILIGLVSWFTGVILSIPITFALNYGVGTSMFNTPLDFVFGSQGIFAWLVGVLLLASLSSLLPAWNASRLTIRELLAYE